jgi:hypothetical protein
VVVGRVIVSRSRGSPFGWITTRIGRSVLARELEVALVVPGTPITAPVPYSISTYGATKTGTFSPLTGLTA